MIWSLLRTQPASTGKSRRRGLALLVVMVLFVILYLVVYQLHFWTTTEEQVARVRYGDAQSTDALHSVSLYVLTLLVEDLKEDVTEAQSAGGAAAGAPPAGPGGPEGGPEAGPETAAGGPGSGPGSGFFIPIEQPGAGGSAAPLKHHDYENENIFNPTVQTVGEVSVKVEIRDNEGRFDLDRLFDYARRQLQAAEAGAAGEVTEVAGMDAEEIASLVEGAGDTETAARTLRERLLQDKGLLGRGGGAGAGGEEPQEPGAGGVTGEAGESGAAQAAVVPGLEDEEELTEFTEPTPAVVERTRQILRDAIEMVFSMNEDYGYLYQGTYSADEIAAEIVDYVIQRRSDPVQNVLYFSSELLNLDSITPEVFYGPQPPIEPGGEYETRSGFVLRRDEFGDLAGEYPYGEGQEGDLRQEDQEQLLKTLQDEFGEFMDFPGLSAELGRLNMNSLTRGMKEPAVITDEYGGEYVLKPPLPVGLDDIFTTFSSGKININTAPMPVLYGLLASLEKGPDSEAHRVAMGIVDWRNGFQEYEEGAEGVPEATAGTRCPDLGQRRRPLPPEEEEDPLAEGLADYDPDALLGYESTYQDLPTNYFTDLRQIELIDGCDDSDRDNLIRANEGIDRVSEEEDTLYRRILNDYTPVTVFGSTYFTVELEAKPEKSTVVKKGHLVVKRDTRERVAEVILWKELQR